MRTKEEKKEKEETCLCDIKGKCGKHYFNCEFCQQSKKECKCD